MTIVDVRNESVVAIIGITWLSTEKIQHLPTHKSSQGGITGKGWPRN